MGYFQAVRSGAEISMNIADLLEQAAPAQYNGANRAQTIREVNDTLQGRSDQSFAMYNVEMRLKLRLILEGGVPA